MKPESGAIDAPDADYYPLSGLMPESTGQAIERSVSAPSRIPGVSFTVKRPIMSPAAVEVGKQIAKKRFNVKRPILAAPIPLEEDDKAALAASSGAF